MLQPFIVSNRDSTYYFANNNKGHFSCNQDERFLPIYQFADEANKKITHLDDFAATFLKAIPTSPNVSLLWTARTSTARRSRTPRHP